MPRWICAAAVGPALSPGIDQRLPSRRAAAPPSPVAINASGSSPAARSRAQGSGIAGRGVPSASENASTSAPPRTIAFPWATVSERDPEGTSRSQADSPECGSTYHRPFSDSTSALVPQATIPETLQRCFQRIRPSAGSRPASDPDPSAATSTRSTASSADGAPPGSLARKASVPSSAATASPSPGSARATPPGSAHSRAGCAAPRMRRFQRTSPVATSSRTSASPGSA